VDYSPRRGTGITGSIPAPTSLSRSRTTGYGRRREPLHPARRHRTGPIDGVAINLEPGAETNDRSFDARTSRAIRLRSMARATPSSSARR